MAVFLRCKKCGYQEEANMDLWLKIIGGTLPAGGMTAWVTYFFAGTGLALPICAAMIAGGIGILIYKNQILKWISSNYKCPKCNKSNWELVEI